MGSGREDSSGSNGYTMGYSCSRKSRVESHWGVNYKLTLIRELELS